MRQREFITALGVAATWQYVANLTSEEAARRIDELKAEIALADSF
jgi:hypothetical protein